MTPKKDGYNPQLKYKKKGNMWFIEKNSFEEKW
jgi:hypothetical protein